MSVLIAVKEMCLYQHPIKSINILWWLEMRHKLFGLALISIGCVASNLINRPAAGRCRP